MSGPNLDDVKISMQRFGWPDYLVFVMMLVSCSLVGVYFGFIEKKSKKGKSGEASDYLVGGRQMKIVPISMSLIARFVAGPNDAANGHACGAFFYSSKFYLLREQLYIGHNAARHTDRDLRTRHTVLLYYGRHSVDGHSHDIYLSACIP